MIHVTGLILGSPIIPIQIYPFNTHPSCQASKWTQIWLSRLQMGIGLIIQVVEVSSFE